MRDSKTIESFLKEKEKKINNKVYLKNFVKK
jgi:hypothetical protein